ncbi:probable NADH dehydrogenase [ubiquinone] 1 alpha subcomplex subunit 12 [Sitophilus oryzae]|uniref:NADH dehydrogenase [ubiquinone] 1 alpha subcomplex subunit 12 n=1 Tax=Sitophilus oryzae TaxID=7048 RepID=A0A6J2Y309_SITOR|nr:probable NADH dehydrogenase [ubiquinone] 1 alpha subcomplex subunit 12 [Sitophilus oryzae]
MNKNVKKYMDYFGITELLRFFQTVKEHGGIIASLYKIYRMDSLRHGQCVGEDKFGNKYFENREYFIGRSRWVEYAPYYVLEYDGSQIPAEWFGWLHYKTDLLPYCDPSRPNYKWMLEHEENMSGTTGQFMPYSTTRPKIHVWVPPKNSDNKNNKNC